LLAWALPDAVASLRFVMAGSLAEAELLGDAFKGGWDQDLEGWRRGVGRTDAMTPVEVEELQVVLRDTRSWVSAEASRIERLAAHLATLSAPAVMPYSEVAAFFGAG
jgi:hypothetical protein